MLTKSFRHTIRLHNVKSEFPGYSPATESNVVCARLGHERNDPARLRYNGEKLSITAHVKRGATKSQCQDCAAIVVNERFAAAAVLDGFGRSGTILSEAVADRLIEVLLQKKELQADAAKTILLEAAVSTLQSIASSIPKHGGTTAAVVLVLPDGCFSAAAVADSALYVRRSTGIERHFDYSTVHFSGTIPIHANHLHFTTYFNARHVVGATINVKEPPELAIEAVEGMIAPGESILLTTDGATKNLKVRITPHTGQIADNSGCDDLAAILRGKRASRSMISALLKEIDSRLERAFLSSELPFLVDDTALLPNCDDVGLVAITMK